MPVIAPQYTCISSSLVPLFTQIQKEKMTAITSETLHLAITERLQASLVQVQDMSGGCGLAFAVLIVSPIFEGKNKLMRHRMVNGALKEEMNAIHAFTQKVFTPEEWELQKVNYAS